MQALSDDELLEAADHDLLLHGLWDQLEENVLSARRLQRLLEFRARRDRDHHARRAQEPHFTLTPLQETAVEASELWGASSGHVAAQLRTAQTLVQYFPGVWRLCLAGQLDGYRAGIVADSARHALDHPEEFWRFAARVTAWLEAGIVTADGRPPLVNRTVKQLRNKVNYELNRIRTDAEKRFRRAFAERSARLSDHGDGMASLTIGNTVDRVQLADYRLTLAAQALRREGDQRTIEQLRADLAIGLLLGTCTVAAGTVTFHPVPAYARPVVNVTVPIQTLMGLSDEPGVLSGNEVIPASLARIIAQDPTSAWYRMLTDPAGRCVELSTTSYRPTRPIWREVVARFGTCLRRNCSVSATRSELDHRTPWPRGQTSVSNLQPGCRRDHKAKHAPGFSVEQCPDGSLRLTTAAGFHHDREVTEQPSSDHWPADELFDTAFTATELLDAVAHLREMEQLGRPPRQDLWDELGDVLRPA